MGLQLSLLLYPGPALAVDAIAAAFAPIVDGRLGTTTLAIRGATHERLAAIATYESTDRYALEVAAADLERERDGLRGAGGLRDVVMAAARLAARGKVVDHQAGAPEQSLPDDWLELVAAELSHTTARAMWAVFGDRYSAARHVVYERGVRVGGDLTDRARMTAAAAQLAGVASIDLAAVFDELELPQPPLDVIARGGKLLSHPEPTGDTGQLELVM